MRTVYTCILLTLLLRADAQQPVFLLESTFERGMGEHFSALARSGADLNGDYRDDLLVIDEDSIHLYIQINEGKKLARLWSMEDPRNVYNISSGDLDNDGINDFLYSGYYNDIRMFSASDKLYNSLDTTHLNAQLFSQGSSLFDINNDGWLDAVITNDDGTSIILMNDGTGQLSKADIIDFNTEPPSNNSGSYSAIWVDLDQDMDQDLYISKCKSGVDDSTDPRRINMAFINEGGSFTDKAADFNLDIGAQSWCADSGDLDNDGDMDIILINHLSPHLLLENDGNGRFLHHDDFTDLGPISTPDLQTSVADFNNDGLLDIVITGQDDYILINEGGLNFKRNNNPFGFRKASGVVVGDFNSDGYLDNFIGFGSNDQPGAFPDELWMNLGGSNNFIQLSLAGILSNRSGIGARVICYMDTVRLTRWLNSGVAYGITNSLNLHIGLGDKTSIDSLVIHWPSGTRDAFKELSVNQHYIATEGGCIEILARIDNVPERIPCQGDTIALSVNSRDAVTWNSVIQDSLFNVHEGGFYYADISKPECINASPVYLIESPREIMPPQLNLDSGLLLCPGDSFLICTAEENTIFINGEDTGLNQLEVTEEGDYFAVQFSECGILNSDTIQIAFTNIYSDSLWLVDSLSEIIIEVEGDSVYWYDDNTGQNIIHQGRQIFNGIIENDTTFYFSVVNRRTLPLFKGGLAPDTLPDFGNPSINGSMSFTVMKDLYLKSLELVAEQPGLRRILILQENDTVYSRIFDLTEGLNRLITEIHLQPGQYRITTDIHLNNEIFDMNSPGLAVSFDQNLNYPFVIDKFVSIDDSSFGNASWFYFYNWEISPAFEKCSSGIHEIRIQLDSTTSVIDVPLEIGTTVVIPNPVDDVLLLKDEKLRGAFDIKLVNMAGVPVRSYRRFCAGECELEMAGLESGLYLLFIKGASYYTTAKFVKQ